MDEKIEMDEMGSDEINPLMETQRTEAILNKISNNIKNSCTGLISVLQGFRKCIA